MPNDPFDCGTIGPANASQTLLRLSDNEFMFEFYRAKGLETPGGHWPSEFSKWPRVLDSNFSNPCI